ncbi:uncharacterized protein LOC119112736 isoform X2 [Pollicipes pollicipes]|uniref:uncharacterized protein LOC119112499 n=1 Tax=Pollicipes pollicipes TaxID=41117 RepID=UPI0018852265|nr:uncharacterized protein LOC119112499 [Pollicipes pollicipes]XP_037092908.1 uncharacterized protein LOC119112736 isoform X2 [Pollicipes pollicipes]
MSASMNILLYTVRKKFSSVQHVSTDTVYSWLYPRPRPDLLLLDTRAAAEFGISRLPHAVHVDPDSDEPTLRRTVAALLPAGVDKTTIACYCSVGYRSATVATRLNGLRAASPELPNFEAVNIEGSIFKWANEGKPLVDAAGEPTRSVHPYNSVFGRLLKAELWQFPQQH